MKENVYPFQNLIHICTFFCIILSIQRPCRHALSSGIRWAKAQSAS